MTRLSLLSLGIVFPVLMTPAWALGAGRDVARDGKHFVELLHNGQWDPAYAKFDGTMKGAMSKEQLSVAWAGVQTQAGKFVSIDEVRVGKHAAYDISDVICTFEHAKLAVRVVFNQKGEVSGLFFKPLAQALPASARVGKGEIADTSYQDPQYVDPKRFMEKDVTVGKAPWALPGTLTMPKGQGPFPAVLFIAGSGPNDRDESIGPNKPLRDLARGLATRGIVSLRYDKRTMVYREKMAQDATHVTVEEEVIDDALIALNQLRKTKHVDAARVFVFGHSLGGTLAPVVASRDGKVKGVVLAAASARSLTDVMLEQISYVGGLPGHQTSGEQDIISDARLKLQAYKRGELDDQVMIMGASVRYFKHLESLQSVNTARSLKCRMLVLQGGRDYQVTKADLDLWRKALAKKNAQFHYYRDLNHLFGKGSGKATPEEYLTRAPVALEVVNDVSKWIHHKPSN